MQGRLDRSSGQNIYLFIIWITPSKMVTSIIIPYMLNTETELKIGLLVTLSSSYKEVVYLFTH
jgi:hypothetical protein